MLPTYKRANPDIHFVGAKVSDELAAHYASADLFFFASETETFGNVITEAMASGLAVLAYDYAAARRHISDSVNGFTAPLGNPDAYLQRARDLAANPPLWQAARTAARKRAETLSWGRIVKAFEEILVTAIRS